MIELFVTLAVVWFIMAKLAPAPVKKGRHVA